MARCIGWQDALAGEAANRPKPSLETDTTEGPHLGVRVPVSGKTTAGLQGWFTGPVLPLNSFWAAILSGRPVAKLRRDFARGTTETSSLFCLCPMRSW